MAGVVKRLRPRIVVPICMGSNPITRPINKKEPYKLALFLCLKFCRNMNIDLCV